MTGAPGPQGGVPELAVVEEREAQLRDYLAVLRKHRLVVAAVALVAVGATAIVTFRQIPLFRAAARINIRRDPPPGATFQDAWSFLSTQHEYMETQYKLIRSRAVARRALELTGRLNTPGFPDHTRTLDAFLGNVTVTPVKDTFLVDVGVIDADPEAAKRDSNAVVDAYVEQNALGQSSTAQEKLQKIEEELPKVQERLLAAQAKLQAFQDKHEVLSFEDHRALIHQNLQKRHAALVDLQGLRRAAEARQRSVERAQADGGDLSALPEVGLSRLLEVYKQQEINLEQERLDLLAKYRPVHPAVLAVEQKLGVVRARVAEELQGIARRIATDFAEAQFQEDDLHRSIEKENETQRDLERQSKEYEFLRNGVTRVEGEYEELAGVRNQISSSTNVNLNNVLVVDRAEAPERPFKPDPMLNLTLALVVGLVGGIGLAFLLEHLDDTLQTPDDVERVLGLPVIGMIPHAGAERTEAVDALVAKRGAQTAAAEAFRALRTSLLFSQSARAATHLLVTSAAAGEGKTFVAANLATVLAQGGARTLLLDADLRRPQVHRVFGTAIGPGLSEVLAGEATAEGAIRRTEIENLDILTAGALPANPSELLGGPRMAALLAELERTYDRVVIDTPPVQAVTDPCVVAALAHATLEVVSVAHVSRAVARRATDALRQVGARMLGVVLNQVEFGTGAYGYQYAAHYGRTAAADGPTK